MFEDTRRVAAKPSKRRLAQIDREVEAVFRRHCSGFQIPVMDLSKIFEAGRAAALSGLDVATAVVAAAGALRTN